MLAIPLIDAIDSLRVHQIMESLLEGIAAHRVGVVIVDTTGVRGE